MISLIEQSVLEEEMPLTAGEANPTPIEQYGSHLCGIINVRPTIGGRVNTRATLGGTIHVNRC